MSDEQRQPDAWVGERWVIEELDDDFVDVAVAGVQSPFLFTTLVDRERRMNDAARADVIGILSRLERGDLDEGWSEEQGERLPTALVAPWLGRAVVVDGLFTATGHVEAGMVFIVTVLESATEGPNMAFPRLSEAGAVDRYRATSAAFRAMGGTDDALWDLTIGGYSQKQRRLRHHRVRPRGCRRSLRGGPSNRERTAVPWVTQASSATATSRSPQPST